MANNGRLLAFEGAQGFGAYTTGGRGGDVVKVTNLKDSGKGSLRWALEDLDGPRIVVFEVGGVIKLNDQINVNGDVTVAGQTAPGGITVEGSRLRVIDDNVIIRGMNLRPGDEKGFDPDNRDGLSIGRSDRKVKDVVIDSNSISWSIDEGLSVWGKTENITISNNIVGEALRDSLHAKGEHSMGMLIGDGASEVSIIGNLLAHNKFRNPTIKDDSHEIEFINNVIYNYGQSGFYITGDSSAHVINNVFIAGKDSSSREPIRFEKGNEKVYMSGNVGDTTDAVSRITSKKLFNPATKDVIATKNVVDSVLETVGANASDRNSIDKRVIDSVIKGKGSIIDSPDDVGGYGRHQTEKALSDTDNDGIPDVFEKIIGSDARKSDANKDADKDGYTNIEEYINGLIDGFGKSSVPKTDDSSQNNGPTAAEEAAAKKKAEEAAKKAAEEAAAEKAAAKKAAAEKKAAEEAAAKKAAEKKAAEKAAAKETTDTSEKIEVEAEDLDPVSGFEERKLNSASGDSVLQGSMKEASVATMVFTGAAGTYDLSIDYFDETDGASQLSVSVNNKEVSSWTWDEKLGSHLANHLSLTSKLIEGLDLEPGDEVTLEGQADGREPLRIDKLVFETQGGNSGPAASDTFIRVEAEEFDLSGFQQVNLKVAENGKVIQRAGDGEHRADYAFEGASGKYDILIDYFDESDGESEMTLAINGKEVENWTWDDHTEHRLANKDNATTRVIENISIKTGDQITLVGEDDGMEPLRIDAVEFAGASLDIM